MTPCELCPRPGLKASSSVQPGVAWLLEGDERVGMVCEAHVLPATLAGYGIDRGKDAE